MDAPVTFYDEAYFRSHYGALLDDAAYRDLLGEYWRHVLFEQTGLEAGGPVLDYGCGLGQVSAKLPDVTLFDGSDWMSAWLRAHGHGNVVDAADSLPRDHFRYILSSHSLEHYRDPPEALERLRGYARPGGALVLVLPIEIDHRPRLGPDHNRHFYCWTFQTITNLLTETGWKPTVQRVIYNPFGLRRLGRRLAPRSAARWAARLGRLKHNYPSTLTVAIRDGR